MGNVRAALIIAALFVVLLSAFGAERFHTCNGSRLCFKQTTGSWLPGARVVADRPDSSEGVAKAAWQDAQDDRSAGGQAP